MRLDGKVVLISGAASGMGASHARAVIREGARVVVGDVADQAGATLVAELGDAARFVHLDVRRDEDWAAAVDTAVREFGRLDALVNNAGILRGAGVVDCTDEDWDLVLAINLTGAFRGIRACVAALEASGAGSVVNISSTAGIKGFADNIAYGVSKWGVRGLTKDAAIDLAPRGIRVNSIHPGNIRTPMIDGLYMDYGHVLQGRPGEPEEISRLVVFLVSDESSFSTGSEFVADGGETAGLPAIARAD